MHFRPEITCDWFATNAIIGNILTFLCDYITGRNVETRDDSCSESDSSEHESSDADFEDQSEIHLSELEKIKSNGGKTDIVYLRGYSYRHERRTDNATYYKCTRYSKTRCKGRLKTTDDSVEVRGQHSHPPNGDESTVKALFSDMKAQASSNSFLSRRIIVTETLAKYDTEIVSAALPTTKSMLEKVSRQRKRNNVGGYISMENINFTPEMTMFSEHEKFLIHDSGPAADRTLVFASKRCCEILSNSEHVFIDATFDAAPIGFTQLLSIHGMCIFTYHNYVELF